jgi:hypothetical protein
MDWALRAALRLLCGLCPRRIAALQERRELQHCRMLAVNNVAGIRQLRTQMFVKTLTGLGRSTFFSSWKAILQVKELVPRVTRDPPDQQRLIFGELSSGGRTHAGRLQYQEGEHSASGLETALWGFALGCLCDSPLLPTMPACLPLPYWRMQFH